MLKINFMNKKEQNIHLLSQYRKTKDDLFRSELMFNNQPLITSIVNSFIKNFSSLNLEFDDLVSEANLKFLECIEKFDLSKTNEFCGYLYRAIDNALKRYVYLNYKNENAFYKLTLNGSYIIENSYIEEVDNYKIDEFKNFLTPKQEIIFCLLKTENKKTIKDSFDMLTLFFGEFDVCDERNKINKMITNYRRNYEK